MVDVLFVASAALVACGAFLTNAVLRDV